MKKRLVAVLMTCALGMTLLAGCGSSSSEEKDSSSKSSDGKVEITFWDNYADTIHTEVYTQLIEDFEKENPDITVKYVPLPSDQAKSKYDVAIQSKSTPDCGVIYQYWMNDFVIQDALLPLDEYYADSDALLDTFVDSMKNTAPDGKFYSLPFYVVPPLSLIHISRTADHPHVCGDCRGGEGICAEGVGHQLYQPYVPVCEDVVSCFPGNQGVWLLS